MFIFDVNALVSAFLTGSNRNSRAFDHAVSCGKIVVTDEILHELTDVFTRKKFDKYQSLAFRLETLAHLETQFITLLPPEERITACRDPKDNKYLLVLHPFQNIPIMTAADFLQLSI